MSILNRAVEELFLLESLLRYGAGKPITPVLLKYFAFGGLKLEFTVSFCLGR